MSQTVISVANACKELGKPIVETGCGLLKSLLGKSCEVAGEMIADELYRWQWERRIEILEKADRRIKQCGITAKVLPKGFFLNFLQSAGEIESPELQELWAKLLASAVESEGNQHPAFMHVLKQLSSAEGRILALLGQDSFGCRTWSETVKDVIDANTEPEQRVEFETTPSTELDQRTVMFALSHLSELGLITVRIRTSKNGGVGIDFEVHQVEDFVTAAFTTFGAAFHSACVAESGASHPRVIDSWNLFRDVQEIATSAVDSAKDASRAAKKASDRLDNIKVARLS